MLRAENDPFAAPLGIFSICNVQGLAASHHISPHKNLGSLDFKGMVAGAGPNSTGTE